MTNQIIAQFLVSGFEFPVVHFSYFALPPRE